MKESTILKICKRATRRNPKSVTFRDDTETTQRILKTTHGYYGVYYDGFNWICYKIKDELVEHMT